MSQKSRLTNSQKQIVGIFTTLIIVVLLINICKLDNFVLLEKRQPGYWNYLSNPHTVYVTKAPLDNGTDNLLISTMASTEFDGMTVTANDDGTLVFNGTYTGETPRYLTPFAIEHLKEGDYILSDGGVSVEGGLQVIFFGANIKYGGETEYGNKVNLPTDSIVHWNNEDYEFPQLYIVIYPGFSASDLMLKPMLRKASIQSAEYQQPVRSITNVNGMIDPSLYYSYLSVSFTKDASTDITSEDWRIFRRSISSLSKYDWVTIDFKDDTGIWFTTDNTAQNEYGNLNYYGQVEGEGTKVVFNELNDFQEFTLSKNSEKEITRIIQETKNKESLDLTNITEFETYLSRLKESNYIVFIVIRDEGVSAINEQLEKHLNELGIQTDFSKLDSANNKKYFPPIVK